MHLTLDCQLIDLINNMPTSTKRQTRSVGRQTLLPTESGSRRACADWCNCLNRPSSSRPVQPESKPHYQETADSSARTLKLSPFYPAEKKSDRSKPLHGHSEWNSSTRIDPDNPFPSSKGIQSRSQKVIESESVNMSGPGKNKVPPKSGLDQREPGKSGQGKNVRFTDGKSTTIKTESHQETHFNSTGTCQGQTFYLSRRPQSEFSTRWPPTPIRATHSGKTTAGRRWPDDQSKVPFYNRSPAGIPTIYTGSVGECMRWNCGSASRF